MVDKEPRQVEFTPISVRVNGLKDSVTGDLITDAFVTAKALANDGKTTLAGPMRVPHVGMGNYFGKIYATGARYIETTARVGDEAIVNRQKLEPCFDTFPATRKISWSELLPGVTWDSAAEATTSIAYTPPEVLQAAADYHREENERRAFDRWHTEVRERYTLEPKASIWKLHALSSVLCVIGFAGFDNASHRGLSTFINHGIGCLIGFLVLVGISMLMAKFSPSPKPE